MVKNKAMSAVVKVRAGRNLRDTKERRIQTKIHIYTIFRRNPADNIYLVCDITEYDATASGDKGIEVYVNDKLIGNIDSKGTTKLKIGYVSEDELLTVKFHADNAEYTLYSISLDKGQAET